MNDEKVTGYCYLNGQLREEARKRRKTGHILLVLCLLVIFVSAFFLGPIQLLPLLMLVFFAVFMVFYRRFGYESNARFVLSESGIQTESTSKKMRRSFSWAEVSVIQITKIEESKGLGIYIPPVDCYVFVKGRENALIRCQATEPFGYIFSNPNRIAVPINERTEPFVTAVAERYGIPMEKSLIEEK